MSESERAALNSSPRHCREMNSNPAAHVDGSSSNPAANDFNHHDPSHFTTELAYPHSSYAQHPAPPGASPPTGTGVEQRRLVQQTPVNPSTRSSRKRKSPSSGVQDPHAVGYNTSGDFSPGGMEHDGEQSPGMSHTGRPLNPGKRAEQNRKAQRAFRERREIHVKELEARSQLLDAALGSADEANRRWEECRALVDQLRVENAGLRAEINGLRAALAAAAQFQHQVQPTSNVTANGATSGESAHAKTSNNREATSNGKDDGPTQGEGGNESNVQSIATGSRS